jgi:hypothetical protein
MSRPGRDSRASRRSIARRERVRDRAIGVAGRSGPSVTVSKVRRAGHESRHERAPTSDRTAECVSLCSTLSLRRRAAVGRGGVARGSRVRTIDGPHGSPSSAVVRVRSALVPRDRPWSRLTSTRLPRRSPRVVVSRGVPPARPRACVMRYTPTSSTVRLKHRHNTNNSQYTSYVRRR